MCNRKIIHYKENGLQDERIVPLMNGCHCPMIKQFRHVHGDAPEEKVRKVYELKHCFDIHTQLPSDIPGLHMVFRYCVCHHPNNVCSVLAPLLMPQPQMQELDVTELFTPGADEDDDTDSSGGYGTPIR